ncbi:unnamed protein product [Leptosia nina]|uniref:Uncharacterized protein n=1 Tax=Leptosia nina TaxID=320188 RepID=A0AAV1IZ94_9NEOP
MEDLKKSVRDVSELVSNKMEEFQQRLQAAQTRSPTLEQTPLAKEFDVFRSSVLFCLGSLQAQIEVLSRAQDELEMRSRRKCLLLHGVNEAKDESSSSIAKMISVLLKCPDLNDNDFGRCHRMGLRQDGKPRPILIKLREYKTKETIWLAKKHLKSTGITLSEFLTKTRHNIFMAARRRFGVSNSWTRDGTIFVMTPDGVRRRITVMKDLETIPECQSAGPSDSKADTSDKDSGPSQRLRNRRNPNKGQLAPMVTN